MSKQYENLANAIILKAVADYRRAMKLLEQRKNYKPALKMKKDVEGFFRSEWFSVLTQINGETLLKRLSEEVAA